MLISFLDIVSYLFINMKTVFVELVLRDSYASEFC